MGGQSTQMKLSLDKAFLRTAMRERDPHPLQDTSAINGLAYGGTKLRSQPTFLKRRCKA